MVTIILTLLLTRTIWMNDVNDDLILVFIAFYFLLRMNNLLLFLMTFLVFNLVVRIMFNVVMFGQHSFWIMYDFVELFGLCGLSRLCLCICCISLFIFVPYFDMFVDLKCRCVTIFMRWFWFVILHSIFVMKFWYSALI